MTETSQTLDSTKARSKYLFVRILEACNADCFMCGFALSRDKYRTDPESFRDILSQALKLEVGYVRFTGGEPLMHRDILPLVQCVTAADARSSLITNGFSLPLMAKQLADAGLDQIVVSLDSGIPELHDEYRNTRGLFAKSILGIQRCVDLGIRVRVNSVVGPHNFDSMLDLRRTLEELGVEQWELSALKLSDEIVYSDTEEVLAIGAQIYETPGLVPMGKRWYGDTSREQTSYFNRGIPPRPSGASCNVARDVMYLDPKEGYLFPCSLLPHRSMAALYGADVQESDGAFNLSASSFSERKQFFISNGPQLCTGCSSSAAGYSDQYDEVNGDLPEWSY